MKKIVAGILIVFMMILSVGAEEEIEEIDEIKESGTYFFELSTETDDGEKVVKVIEIIIVNPTGEVDELNQEGIDARNIQIKEEDVEKLKDVNWVVEKSNAYAWNIKTGERVVLVSVHVIKIENDNADYLVELSTARGTKKRIKVYVEESQVFEYTNIEKGMTISQLWRVDSRSLPLIIFVFFLFPIVMVILFFLYFRRKTRLALQVLYDKESKI